MATVRILGSATIPAKFIRLDDRVTAADQYVNARDMQILRNNHNMLLARRVRQPVAQFGGKGWQPTGTTNVYSIRAASREMGDIFLTTPITVPIGTRELRFTMTGVRLANTSVDIYPCVDGPDESTEPNDAYKLTIGSTNVVKNVTFPVPTSVTATGLGTFYAIIGGGLTNEADLNTGIAIVDVSPTTFTAATSMTVWSAGCYFSNLGIEPRRMVSRTAIGANFLYTLDAPFNVRPIPGTTTVSTKPTYGFNFNSAALHAVQITDFTTYRGIHA